jgi:hypothetical protein
MRFAIAAMMTLFLIGAIFAQDATQPAAPETAADAGSLPTPETPKSSFAFSGGVSLGSDVLLTGTDALGNSIPETWTRIDFMPDFAFGKIGVGLDLTLHFMLYPDPNTAFKPYAGDWVPGNGKSFFDIYLPKLLYIRYGLKGEDPFFAKLGSINDLSLGDGFIMSNYSNMLFMPEQRIFGLDIGVDGSLFNFPYAGIEAVMGNLARFDVVGSRLYARPLVGTEIPILKNMQVGATVVADTNPYLYADTTKTAFASASAVAAYGADIAVPILGGKAFPLTAFTDLAFDPNESAGWMVGLAGRLITIFTYGAQLRILQDGFIPSYFDADYDVYRAQKYDAMQLPHSSAVNPGWYASLGISLLTDKLVFTNSLDGPFKASGPGATNPAQTDYPHLRSVLALGELPGFPFFFDASYEKYLLGAKDGFFPDLVDPTDAIIGLDVNYRTGASVLTLAYNAQWDPNTGKFNVTSSLQASVRF